VEAFGDAVAGLLRASERPQEAIADGLAIHHDLELAITAPDHLHVGLQFSKALRTVPYRSGISA
jgi:hypothetical protein